MIKKIKFAREAANEFLDSVEWYEARSKGPGLRFTDEIDSTIERIKLNPELYPAIVDDIKRIQALVNFHFQYSTKLHKIPSLFRGFFIIKRRQ